MHILRPASVSAGRVLIWSADPAFRAEASAYLRRQSFTVSMCAGPLRVHRTAELLIADADTLPPTWERTLVAARLRHPWLALVLASTGWPNVGRLRFWRPYGYVRRPVHMEHLLRVVRVVLAAVQASHRQTADLDRRGPVVWSDNVVPWPAADRAA